MSRPILVTFITAVIFCSYAEGGLSRFFHLGQSTTTTTTTSKPSPFFINNNIPTVESGCMIRFECKKKLLGVENPRPCIKYCVKAIDCPNKLKTRGGRNQCVELDEEQVLAEYQGNKKQTHVASGGGVTEKIMQVAMIDFPCQPGYLPDSRGRCREVW